MAEKKYQDIVAQAVKAVSGVSDPALKQIAFQKVLDDLIGANEESRENSASNKSKRLQIKPQPDRTKTKGGPTQYIQEMVDDGFFKQPKTVADVRSELSTRAHRLPNPTVAVTLMRFCQKKILRRSKAKGEDGSTYLYSLW